MSSSLGSQVSSSTELTCFFKASLIMPLATFAPEVGARIPSPPLILIDGWLVVYWLLFVMSSTSWIAEGAIIID